MKVSENNVHDCFRGPFVAEEWKNDGGGEVKKLWLSTKNRERRLQTKREN
jgi:hypothetical protein